MQGGAGSGDDPQAQYAVYIDAGSSGTRCHVFRYHVSPWPAYVQLELPEPAHSVEPGLSHYAGRAAMAAECLLPLLQFAYEQVRWISVLVPFGHDAFASMERASTGVFGCTAAHCRPAKAAIVHVLTGLECALNSL